MNRWGGGNMALIIRNCPAIQQGTCEKYGMCQDCTDCVLKKITELCKKVKLTYGKLDKPLTATQCTALFSRATLADEILDILEIEEIKL